METTNRVGAAIFLLNDDSICLGLRADGTWGIPGGAVEPGEDPRLAAVREIAEETGVFLNIDDVIHTVDVKSKGKHGYDWTTVTYKAVYKGDLKTMEPDKFSQVGWFPKNNLPSPLFAPLKTYIEVQGLNF